ncbi:hypothetical protein ABTU80_003407 [Enterobacter cloacae]
MDDLHRLADAVFDCHQKGKPVEQVELDRMAMAFARIHVRFDEWLRRPGVLSADEPLHHILNGISLAMKSLLLDIARIRGGNWSQ